MIEKVRLRLPEILFNSNGGLNMTDDNRLMVSDVTITIGMGKFSMLMIRFRNN